MIATVKIIPFAVGETLRCDAALRRRRAKPFIRVAPYKIRKVGVVSTLLPGLAAKVVDKTLEDHRRSGWRRPARASSPSAACRTSRPRSPRRSTRCCNDGAELVIVFGASAIADRRDVIPAAIEAVGGRIEHFGMPVDPGNLMLIGAARRPAGARRAGLRALAEGKRLRLGADAAARRAAGVARRHHRHGRRRAADGDRDAAAAARGAGARTTAGAIAAIILAAGRSTRMGGPNKLLAEIGGKPLVRIAAEEALASRAQPGDRRHRPSARAGRGGARKGSTFKRVHNPDFADGLVDLAQDRARRRAGRRRRRARLPRRHAAGRRGADRPS